VRDLRRLNRSVVLSRLFFDGPLSRYELSSRTGRSAATISNVATELLEDQLIVEAGLVESDGRPRVLLRVNPSYGYVIGADVGETRLRVELFDLSMERLAAIDHAVADGANAVAVVSQLAAGLHEVVHRAGVEESRVIGAGIGLTGIVEHGATAIVHAQAIGWDAVPIETLLRNAGIALPLFFENGAKTQGQAEMWFGAGRGARHAVIALVGAGVGAAVITGGRAYRGNNSSAAEWGHTVVSYGGRACRCGTRGCLEAYVGAGGILDRYHQARAKRRPAESDRGAGAQLRAGIDALLAAAPRSAVAARVLDETAGYLGAGMANLVNMYNPELIVLGGWVGLALGPTLLPRIREAAGSHALRYPFRQTSIELCQLDGDAVAIGAATVPVAALLRQGASPSASTTATVHSSMSVVSYSSPTARPVAGSHSR
jgi:predicted NBD/HSP70 family sugar kinase